MMPEQAYAGIMADVQGRPNPMVAEAELPLPAHPEVALWRPAHVSDLDAIWRLNAAISLADHPNHVTTRAGVAALFDLSYFDPERDSLIGEDANGDMIAHGLAMFPTGYESVARSIVVGGVHPEFRKHGIGRALLHWQLSRARRQLATADPRLPGRIVAYTDERAPLTVKLYRRAGLRLSRYFFALERMADEPIPGASPADGIRLAPYSPDLAEAVHEARDEAFRDAWGSQPMSDEAWNSFLGRPSFRRGLSFVAFAVQADGTEDIAGFILGTVNEGDWEHQGFSSSYVSMVGVRRAWRGRGIARALLIAHLSASTDAGYERVTLDVDSDSPTGALDLYTDMGFRRTHRKLSFTLDV
jgi:ribosomal protein S18 acetylase RimI-like enzyme